MMMGAPAVKKKRGPQKAYNEETLSNAVQMILTGRMTYRKAEEQFGIKKSTLYDKVSGRTSTQHKGPEPFLGRDIEKRVCEWVTNMARIGYGQTREALMDKVQVVVNTLNIPTPWEHGRPSKKWYELFMKRNQHLKIRQAQLLSRERAGVTREGLKEWYDELYQYLHETANLDILEQPLRIYNCDETGFPISPKPPKVICESGAPNIYARGSSSKQTITTLLCASAAGTYIPPMIVYPGTNFKRDFMTDFFKTLPDVEFGHSPSGWMDQELFLQWLRNGFDKFITRSGVKRPVLLIIDGAKVHLSLWISEFCDANKIILFVLYPNSTHLTQPLDLTLMGSVKVHYKEAVRKWILEHPFEPYNKFAFPVVFRDMWQRAATVVNAAKGFKVAGFYPWNPDGLDERKLFPSMIAKREDPPEIADASVTIEANEPQPHASHQDAPPPVRPAADKDVQARPASTPAPTSIVFGGQRYNLTPIKPSNIEVLDDILKLPESKKPTETKKFGKLITKLPRCVSDKRYRDILQERENEKKRIETEKAERKKERKEAAEKKKAEKAAATAKRKAQPKRGKKKTPVVIEESSDEEDTWSSSSSSSDDFYEGSTSRCAECDLKFRGLDKKMAIGCDTDYCRRWYHRHCTDLELAGMTEREIEQVPFVCKYC